MVNNYYNYIYLDPTKPNTKGVSIFEKDQSGFGMVLNFDYEPFYVGKGTGKRFKQHKYKPSGKFMASKLKSLKDKGVEPIIIVLETTNESNAYALEKRLIKAIGRRDLGLGTLCNLTDGGETNLGRIKSNDEITKWKNSYGKRNLTEEHKKNIGIANKGKISKNTILGRKRKIEVEGNYSNKVVLQLDLSNNIIKEFSSIKEAHETLKLSRTFAGDRCRNHDLKIINNSYRLIFKSNDNKI